ncbi:OLC1v1027158C5 [Oldenlandia corymbosa var. corymbosa]|nr:OLC1v1027158C5 [Oldenlandia corymbosa var. corymbosa]
MKFKPKLPRTPKKPLTPKKEVGGADDDGDDGEINEALLRKVNDHLSGRRPQASKKSSVEVVFTQGVASSSPRMHSIAKGESGGTSDDIGSSDFAENTSQILYLPPTSTDCVVKNEPSAMGSMLRQKKRAYKEPWDYNNSYYPITLPLRRPNSGDPEVLDQEEFGEAGTFPDYDESALHSASDLGLMEEDARAKMLFLQLPADLPLGQCPATAASKDASGIFKLPGHASADLHSVEKAGGSTTPGTVALSNGNGTVASPKRKETVASSKGKGKGKEICVPTSTIPGDVKGKEFVDKSISSGGANFAKGSSELPVGHMGKLLVYKSGAVKLKLGDILYDVTPGSDCISAQDVVAINTMERDCCVVGKLTKRAVVTPDVDILLDHHVINI